MHSDHFICRQIEDTVVGVVVVVNLYSHSECMQHVLRNHVRTGTKLKVIPNINKNKIKIMKKEQ